MISIDAMDKAMEDAHLSSVDMDLPPHTNLNSNLNTNGRMMRPNQSGRRVDDDDNVEEHVEGKSNISQEKDAYTNYLPQSDHSGSNSCSGSAIVPVVNKCKKESKCTETSKRALLIETFSKSPTLATVLPAAAMVSLAVIGAIVLTLWLYILPLSTTDTEVDQIS